MSNEGSCRSCRARILWAVTEAGKNMPVDPEPVESGNVMLERRPDTDGLLAFVVQPGTRRIDVEDDGTRYVSHFVTCPNRKEHRR